LISKTKEPFGQCFNIIAKRNFENGFRPSFEQEKGCLKPREKNFCGLATTSSILEAGEATSVKPSSGSMAVKTATKLLIDVIFIGEEKE
jgi:hypothetical protein